MGKFFKRNEHPNDGLSDRRLQAGALSFLDMAGHVDPEPVAREKLMRQGYVPRVLGELSVPELVGYRMYQRMGGATEFVVSAA